MRVGGADNFRIEPGHRARPMGPAMDSSGKPPFMAFMAFLALIWLTGFVVMSVLAVR